MRSYCIALVIFFLIPTENRLHAQNPAETMRFASAELAAGNTEAALMALQRVAFFSSDSMLPAVYTMLGEVYEDLGRYSDAAYCYDRVFEASNTDSARIDFSFRTARCEMQAKNWDAAASVLFQLPGELDYESERRRHFYWGYYHFSKAEFEASRSHFIQSLDSLRLGDSITLNSLFADRSALYRPSPRAARVMSMIIPGSGQFYAGDLREGINSLALSASLFGVAVLVSSRYGYWNGLITIMPWFQRYYSGGYRNAYIIAEARREERRRELLIELIKVMSADEGSAPGMK